MSIDLRGEARILASHGPLHGCQVGAAHQQQRGRGVAQVVEANVADLAHGKELEATLAAATEAGVGRRLAMVAPLAPALVDVPRDHARMARPAALEII